jgi:Myb-like DNA-binding domain
MHAECQICSLMRFAPQDERLRALVAEAQKTQWKKSSWRAIAIEVGSGRSETQCQHRYATAARWCPHAGALSAHLLSLATCSVKHHAQGHASSCTPVAALQGTSAHCASSHRTRSPLLKAAELAFLHLECPFAVFA